MIIQEKIRAEFVVIDHSSKTVHMFNSLSMINPSDLATFSIVNKSIAGHTKALSINFWFSQNQRYKHRFMHTKLIFIGDGVTHPLKTEFGFTTFVNVFDTRLAIFESIQECKRHFQFHYFTDTTQ